jgi:hypothetical protein
MMPASLRQPEPLALDGGGASAPPFLATDPNLCASCHTNPRHAGGRLSRCLACIKREADRDRADRIAAEALVEARRAELTAECRTCKKVRALADFPPHRTAKNGRRKDCRSCIARGRTPRKERSPARKARDRALAQSPERLAKNLEASLAWQARNPEANAAHKAVNRAVKAGTLLPPKSCQAVGCKRRKRLHSHHNSYSPRSWLRVSWLCPGHHKSVHCGLPLKLKAGAMCRTARAPRTA